jgi:3-hydroxymyristoyl/3-hydroxydecanoyl-(acyl carrier protein) dehydratase
LLGYYLGATLQYPDEQFAIRSLDGRATVLKDIDLRDKTIRQHTTLLSNSAVDRTVLQAFSYDLSADGEVFYTGESLFGYFNEQALGSQAGLDSGRHVPPWLDQQPVPASRPVMRVDLREEKSTGADSSGDLRIGSGQVRLVDWVDLVPGGGDHGAGYLRGRRRITPQDWYFSCHFHRDPVMPGSLGVEAILQAIQIYVIETGLAARLHRPRFALPAGVEMRWTYRAQIVRSDTEMDFEVHIKEIRDEPGRLLLIGDANLWKSGMRIYELTDVALAIVSEQY